MRTPQPDNINNPGGYNRTPAEIDRDERRRLQRESSGRGSLVPIGCLVLVLGAAVCSGVNQTLEEHGFEVSSLIE